MLANQFLAAATVPQLATPIHTNNIEAWLPCAMAPHEGRGQWAAVRDKVSCSVVMLELVCSSSCQVSYDWFFVQLIPGWPSPSSAQSTPLSSTGSRAVTTGEKTWLWLVAEQSYRWLYREYIRPLCMRRSHLLQHSPPLGQRSWCGKRENHPLKRKRAEPNFQGFYCSTWNQILSLTGLWQLLGREEILPKSSPALAPLSPATSITKMIAAIISQGKTY